MNSLLPLSCTLPLCLPAPNVCLSPRSLSYSRHGGASSRHPTQLVPSDPSRSYRLFNFLYFFATEKTCHSWSISKVWISWKFRQSRRLHRERERSILIDWASWQSNVVMKSKKMDKQKWINQAIFEQQLFIASQRRLILAISLTGSPTIERTPSSLQSRTNQSNYTCSTCTHRKRKKEGREVKKRRHRRRRRRRRRG